MPITDRDQQDDRKDQDRNPVLDYLFSKLHNYSPPTKLINVYNIRLCFLYYLDGITGNTEI